MIGWIIGQLNVELVLVGELFAQYRQKDAKSERIHLLQGPYSPGPANPLASGAYSQSVTTIVPPAQTSAP